MGRRASSSAHVLSVTEDFMSSKVNESRPVEVSHIRKQQELAAISEIAAQCNIAQFGWRKGIHSPRHDVLAVLFYSYYENNRMPLLVDITPTKTYPNEEPFATVIDPDVSGFRDEGLHNHLYNELEGRVICAHLKDWKPTSSMARYFLNCVYPWANNLTAWIMTDGKWAPENWIGAK
jgi:hypothetical protein